MNLIIFLAWELGATEEDTDVSMLSCRVYPTSALKGLMTILYNYICIDQESKVHEGIYSESCLHYHMHACGPP